MPFAWAARPIFHGNKQLDNSSEFSPFFKLEKLKLGEEDMLKTLAEFHKTRSALSKLKIPSIPGQFIAKIHPLPESHRFVTPSIVDVAPTSTAGTVPCVEIQNFPLQNASAPQMSFYHFLYAYPLEVDFSNASTSGNRARNIVCRIDLLETDEAPLMQPPTGTASIFGRSFGPRYTTHSLSTVSYHSPKTAFYDEVKISLPIKLSSKQHLFFTFYHVSVDSQKKEKTESVVGYSWLPLLQDLGRMDGEFELPVLQASSNSTEPILPGNYLKMCTPSSADRFGIKFLDGGKPIFRVRTACWSSIYTQDDHLRRFFRAVESDDGTESASRNLRERIKALHAVHPNDLILYFPVIFNTLFELLTSPSALQCDVSLEVLKFLIFATDFIRENGLLFVT
jgi:hypothetical protein